MDPQSTREVPPSIPSIVAKLVRALAELPPGDKAALRRLDAHYVASAAFWRLMASVIDPDGFYGSAAQRRWAVIVAAVARLANLHAARQRVGVALSEADVAEMRVLRLLRAHDDGLGDAIRQIVHQLESKAVAVDALDIARLVLSDGRDDEEDVRRRIASDYYRAEQKKDSKGDSA